MCTRYVSPEDREIEAVWHIGARTPILWQRQLFPRSTGPFIRRAKNATGYERELGRVNTN